MPTSSSPWPGVYAVATLAGVGLGVLLVLGLLPRVPHQLTAWMQSVDRWVAILAVVAGGAAIGASLAAVAHLGVRWQLRRRSNADIS